MVAIVPNEAGTFVSSGFCCSRGKKITAFLLPVLARARAYWPAAQPIRGLLPLCAGWATPTRCLVSRVRVAPRRTRGGGVCTWERGAGTRVPREMRLLRVWKKIWARRGGPRREYTVCCLSRGSPLIPACISGRLLCLSGVSRASLGSLLSLLPPNLLFSGGDRQAFNREGWTCRLPGF